MRRILVICFFIINMGDELAAQNRSHLKGKVLDSLDSSPLERVTIGITDLKDSSFVSYTSSTKTGEFHFKNLPSGRPLAIIASMVGYRNAVKILSFKQGETFDLGVIRLSLKNNLLSEVIVSGERQAIVISKDTIEFAVEAFKVRPNAVVEELLKKLPGVQVDNDGTITVNGKSVSKLTIDGKEFFGNDPKIASQNLNADLLDKVQVYDDRENDPDHLIEDSKVSKIINLKFKRAFKKSIFGKVYAGGGTAGRFESGGLFNMFRDTLQVSVIGVGNNLNRTGFSSNDLSQMGGFNRSGQNALYDGSISVGGRSGDGIENIVSGGFNLNNDYGKKLKMNLIYFYTRSQNTSESSSFNRQFLTSDTLYSNYCGSRERVENKHNISGLIRWRPDTLTKIDYTPKVSFIDNHSSSNSIGNSFNGLAAINNNSSKYSDNGSRIQLQHLFNYYRRLKKPGQSLNISHNLSLNPDLSSQLRDFDLESFTATVPSEVIRRMSSNNNKSASGSLDITYRHPFNKKFSGDVTLGGNYGLNTREVLTFDQDPQSLAYTILQESQSSDLDRYQWTNRIKTGLTYKFSKKISLDLGLAGEWLQVNNRFHKNVPDLNQHYFNLLPSARLQAGIHSLNYNSSVNQPTVYNLQPITIQSSALYSFTGNPFLKPSRNHNLSLNSNKYFQKQQLNIYLYLSGSAEENSVTMSRTLTNNGVSSNSPVNKNGKYNINTGAGIFKNLKKINDWRIRLESSVNWYYMHDFFILNQDEGFQNRRYLSIGGSVSVNWKDKVELSPRYRVTPQATSYTGVDFEDVRYTAHRLETKYTIRWPKRIYWEGNYEYHYDPRVTAGFQKDKHLLNAAVAMQMFKKDRGEIKLSCYDILDQNISVFRYAGLNSISDNQSQILKRYFLLTYLVKFNKTTTK